MVQRVLVAGLLMSMAAKAASPVADNAKPGAGVTFNKNVLPILEKNCQTCHRPGQIAPMSLLTYQEARPWAKAMKAKVLNKEMPPWNADPAYGQFSNDRSLKQTDIDMIVAWADQGAPEGDPKDAPPPVKWPETGWEIQPDHVVDVTPYTVPAHPPNNAIEWATTVVPSGFTEDTWITSIEILPEHLKVTHHICIQFMPHRSDVVYNTVVWKRPNIERDDKGVEIIPAKGQPPSPGDANLKGAGGNEACYLPGVQAADYRPKHLGKLVPAQTDIVVTLHYQPNGQEVVDHAKIGFTVSKEAPQRVWYNWSIHGLEDRANFAISPNDPDYEPPPGIATLLVDADLVWMAPHMHLRGKDMTYNVIYPDGHSQTVLSVPRYDFNWQLGYELAQPIHLPKGSTVVITGHYDNSINNKFNPDPTQTVYYGNMTWEEMFNGFIGVIVDKDVDPKKVFRPDATAGNQGGGG